jgi:glycogen debranching enzyme
MTRLPHEIALHVFPGELFIYDDRSLLVTDRDGHITGGMCGLYEHDMRLLSRYRLLVHGEPPRLDALSAVDHFSSLAYYVAPPTPTTEHDMDALGLSLHEADRQVVVRVARSVSRGLHEDYDVTNYGLTPASLDVTWEVDADFADLFEARGGERKQTAPIDTGWEVREEGGGAVRFDYRHPQLDRGALVRFETDGRELRRDGGRVSLHLELGPRESYRWCVKVCPIVEGNVQEPRLDCDSFGSLPTEAARTARRWADNVTSIKTSNAVVQRAWDRAVADLTGLALSRGETSAEYLVPAAGQPLYGTLFGRDTLTIAGQAMFLSPTMAEGALRLMARHIGTKDDPFYDEQPGRVPQQVRDNPLSLLRITPGLHDYGDYAAPCAYLVLLGGYHLVSGDKEKVREFAEPARRVLDWLDNRADIDGDGFLEYKTRSPVGQTHQGWKDSGDAVRYPDGSEAQPPIAACEIQGYWYVAKMLMAEVFRSLGETGRAFEQVREAAALKRRFNERFWVPEERFFAFALDADKKQVKTVASNVGHCLTTGIIESKYIPSVVRRLMQPDMFSGWGIRTVSSDNPAYHPVRYHLGSVWPSENATIAFGMKRYGFDEECNRLCKAMFDASTLFEHGRLPEAFGGFPRDNRHPHPGLYPDSCAPQGWSASAVGWLVQSMLGIWTYAPAGLVFVNPALPEWLPSLQLRDLHVGKGHVTIGFKRRKDGTTGYKVLESRGGVRVVRQAPPGAIGVGPLERVGQAVRSLVGS